MMKEQIRGLAKALGINKIGFSKNSVAAIFPYYVKGENGNLSMYARSIDYHTVCEEKLKKLSELLLDLGATEVFVHVDKGGLDDRKAAFEAGLGFYGKNGMLISPEYGSYFFIGQVVHNLEIEPDVPLEKSCISCGACISRCPGKALSENGFEVNRCLSEISQRRGQLTEAEQILIRNNGLCWGCDVCQQVCPHNQGLETTAIPEFLNDRITELMPEDVDSLSNREFKEKYGEYAFSWRGKAVLQRNLRVLF